MNEKNDSGVAIDSTPLLAMLSDEEQRFRGMQKIMEHDGQTDTAMQMRYIAAGIEHARIKVEAMIANARPHAPERSDGSVQADVRPGGPQ